MHKARDRVLALVCSALAGGAAGCDNWPVQDGGGGGGATVPSQRSVGTDCESITPIMPSSSQQVNGALCFGLAFGSSTSLGCLPVGDVTKCQDPLGMPFEVRWSGSEGIAETIAGKLELGRVQLVQSNTFDVSLDEDIEGLCTITTSPELTAKLCPYE